MNGGGGFGVGYGPRAEGYSKQVLWSDCERLGDGMLGEGKGLVM